MRHVFDVNLLSGMQLIAELTPTMREQGGGRIINISSLSRYVGAPLASAYAATKGGMEALTACMRLELSPWNIKLCVIVPGFVDTPTFDKSRAAGQHLRDDPGNPYRQLMEDLDAFATDQLKSAVSPEEVGKAVVRAATARPRRRVTSSPSARAPRPACSAPYPIWIADRLLLKMYKWGPWA